MRVRARVRVRGKVKVRGAGLGLGQGLGWREGSVCGADMSSMCCHLRATPACRSG